MWITTINKNKNKIVSTNKSKFLSAKALYVLFQNQENAFVQLIKGSLRKAMDLENGICKGIYENLENTEKLPESR